MTEATSFAVEHDAYAYFGRKLMESHIRDHYEPSKKHPDSCSLVSRGETPLASTQASSQSTNDKVGIIGAGAGGLYTALILDSLGIPYEILEASGRTGGRLYTYRFDKGSGTHNYYDAGAMSFPRISTMRRLCDLFKYKPLNDGEDKLKDKLIPYHLKPKEAAGGYMLYNNVRLRAEEASKEVGPFRAKEYLEGNPNASAYISAGVESILRDATDHFMELIEKDVDSSNDKGWLELMEHDTRSFRSYLLDAYKPSIEFLATHIGFPNAPLPSDVIDWMEAMDNSIGSYDKPFLEVMLYFRTFGQMDSQNIQWTCLDGGAQVLSDAMHKYLQQRKANCILFCKKVSSIRLAYPPGSKGPSSGIEVEVAGEDHPRTYSDVVSTIPLTCLRTLDLDGCNLSVKQTNAMRRLRYSPAVKIGVLFKSAWWSQDPIKITGGQSFTDHPIRTVCYPSYGLEKGPNETHVLIASYCWTDEATRMSTLVNTGDSTVDKELKHIVLRDLAAVHGVDLRRLKDELVDIFPYDWTHNPLSMGAFAFYKPGEFSTLYKTLNLPAADKRLHFASEALSTRNAWIVGALSSAWRAVHGLLCPSTSNRWSEKLKEFYEKWGIDDEWTSPQFRLETEGGEVDPDVPNLLYHFLSIHHNDELIDA